MNWLAELWGAFSLWTSTQPTFLQVAIGMGLFFPRSKEILSLPTALKNILL
jgi:hypothetical protein